MTHSIKSEVILSENCSNEFENQNVNRPDLDIKVIKTEVLDGESPGFNVDPLDIGEMGMSKNVLSMEKETNSIPLRSSTDSLDFDVRVTKTEVLDYESPDFKVDPLDVQEMGISKEIFSIEKESNSIPIRTSQTGNLENRTGSNVRKHYLPYEDEADLIFIERAPENIEDGTESDAYKYFLPDEDEISLTCGEATPEQNADDLSCNFCKKRLFDKDYYVRHIQKCERKYLCSNEQPKKKALGPINYKCSQCDYTTSKGSRLRAHVVIHSNDRQFLCKMCQRTFSRRSNYEHHLKTHDKLRAKEFSCQDCGNSYYDKISLRRHVRDRHSSSSDQKYKCPQCPYTGVIERNLKLHMIRHSDEGKRFRCERCAYATYWKAALVRHMSTCKPTKP